MPAVWGLNLALAVVFSELARVPAGALRRGAYVALGLGLATALASSLGKQDRLVQRTELLWQVLARVEQDAPAGVCIGWLSCQASSTLKRASTLHGTCREEVMGPNLKVPLTTRTAPNAACRAGARRCRARVVRQAPPAAARAARRSVEHRRVVHDELLGWHTPPLLLPLGPAARNRRGSLNAYHAAPFSYMMRPGSRRQGCQLWLRGGSGQLAWPSVIVDFGFPCRSWYCSC